MTKVNAEAGQEATTLRMEEKVCCTVRMESYTYTPLEKWDAHIQE